MSDNIYIVEYEPLDCNCGIAWVRAKSNTEARKKFAEKIFHLKIYSITKTRKNIDVGIITETDEW